MPTSVISNVAKSPSGTPVAGVKVTATLWPGPGFRVSDNSEVASFSSTTSDGTGAWSLALEQTANITPAGTTYIIEEQFKDKDGGPRFWMIQVGAANATLQASLVSAIPEPDLVAYLTQTAGDARYALKGEAGVHPDLLAHDTLGLATQAELDSAIANAAQRATTTDAVVYVSTGTKANDANDGLSWGTAKATLAAALAALPATGGTLEVGAGTFTLGTQAAPAGIGYANAGLLVPSNVIIRGRGPRTTTLTHGPIPTGTPEGYFVAITNADTTNGNKNIVVRDIGFDLPAPLENATGMDRYDSAVYFAGVSHAVVENCWIKNGSVGFNATAGTQNTATVLAAGKSTGNVIRNCVIENTTQSIFLFQSTDCWVVDNYVEKAWDDVVLVGSAGAGHHIEGNRFNAAPVVATKGGVTAVVYLLNDGAAGGGAATNKENMRDIIVSRNVIFGNTGHNSGAENGIYISGAARDVLVSENLVYSNKAGFSLTDGNVRNLVVEHNHVFKNGGKGIQFQANVLDSLVESAALIGNYVWNNTGSGIELYSNGTLDVQVLGNWCYDDQGVPTQTTSLNVGTETAKTVKIKSVANHFRNTTAQNLYGAGTPVFTGDNEWVEKGPPVKLEHTTSTSNTLESKVAGDPSPRLSLRADGVVVLSGGHLRLGTSSVEASAPSLHGDGSNAYLAAGPLSSIYLRTAGSSSNNYMLQVDPTPTGSRLTFYSDTGVGDTNLYRSAANVLKTDDEFQAASLVAPILANRQTGTAYTLVLSDAAKVIESDNAAANTVTIPPNSSVAFPTGTVVSGLQYGAGQTTVAGGTGVTLRAPDGLVVGEQYGTWTARKIATDEWEVQVAAAGGGVAAHAATHASGGSDPVTLAQSQITNLTTDLANKQPLDADLTAIAALASAADKLPYATGAQTWALADLSAFARTLLDDAAASNARATLGLVIGTDVQAQDAELAALAALVSAADRLPYFTGSGTAALATFTAFGRSLVDDADATAGRTTLGLGDAATKNTGTTAGTVAAGDDSRFTTITANRQTVSYTLVAADAAKAVEMDLAGANTLTVPPNSSVAFAVGTVIEGVQWGAGQTTITPGAGVTIRASGGKLKTAAQYAQFSLRKIATDEWLAAGDLVV